MGSLGSLDSLVSCDQEQVLIQNVCEIYDNLSTLQFLTCMPPSPIDVTKLSGKVQGIRSKLIRLCGEAEGLLESHFSALLANALASNLIAADPDLSQRMLFHDTDIMNVTTGLSDYEVVFLAALVGLNKEDKRKVIDHLAKYMAPGSLLMLRSAHGARGFLYPILEPSDLPGFEVLAVFHPMDDVINW
ncbi:hypothetical protein MKX01_012949 [Papaver californicum]|nr:hypothetical protein MKX01_012949 [Papaver californicum]